MSELGVRSGNTKKINTAAKWAEEAVSRAPELTEAQTVRLRLILTGALSKLDQVSAMADTNDVGGTSHVA